MDTIRVVVAEDNLQLRDMIAQYLAQQDGIDVTGTAANGAEPEIPFTAIDDYRAFRDSGFDFVTMAQSPRYAPASADRIMGLLAPYIRPL